jgi:hypothetical protein
MRAGATLGSRIARAASKIWRGVREWCGDAAYERYLEAHAKHSCEEFYVEQLQKRYSRVSRCC